MGSSGYSTVHLRFGMYDKVTPIPWIMALVDSMTSVIIDIGLSHCCFELFCSLFCAVRAFSLLLDCHLRTRCLPATIAPYKLVGKVVCDILVLDHQANCTCQGGAIST